MKAWIKEDLSCFAFEECFMKKSLSFDSHQTIDDCYILEKIKLSKKKWLRIEPIRLGQWNLVMKSNVFKLLFGFDLLDNWFDDENNRINCNHFILLWKSSRLSDCFWCWSVKACVWLSSKWKLIKLCFQVKDLHFWTIWAFVYVWSNGNILFNWTKCLKALDLEVYVSLNGSQCLLDIC